MVRNRDEGEHDSRDVCPPSAHHLLELCAPEAPPLRDELEAHACEHVENQREQRREVDQRLGRTGHTLDQQAKTQARLDWFDTLGSDLAEMVDRG